MSGKFTLDDNELKKVSGGADVQGQTGWRAMAEQGMDAARRWTEVFSTANQALQAAQLLVPDKPGAYQIHLYRYDLSSGQMTFVSKTLVLKQ